MVKPGVRRTLLRQPHASIPRALSECSPKGTQASHLDPSIPAAREARPGSQRTLGSTLGHLVMCVLSKGIADVLLRSPG